MYFTVPPKFLTGIQDISVIEHDSATFRCQTNLVDLPLKWYLNGRSLTPSQRFQIEEKGTSHKLVITDALETDAGTVEVRVENVKTTANLNVKGRVKFHIVFFTYTYCTFSTLCTCVNLYWFLNY